MPLWLRWRHIWLYDLDEADEIDIILLDKCTVMYFLSFLILISFIFKFNFSLLENLGFSFSFLFLNFWLKIPSKRLLEKISEIVKKRLVQSSFSGFSWKNVCKIFAFMGLSRNWLMKPMMDSKHQLLMKVTVHSKAFLPLTTHKICTT